MAAVANLTWDSMPGAISYNVEYKESGSPTFIFHSNTINNYELIDNLLYATSYDFRITSVCNSGNSGSTIITSISTCNAAEIIEGFTYIPSTINTPATAANVRIAGANLHGLKLFSPNSFDGYGNYISGTPPITNPTNTLWASPSSLLSEGRLNNVGVWPSTDCTQANVMSLPNEWVGFYKTFNFIIPTIVYIGISCANYFKITINGVTIIENDILAPGQDNYKTWHVYPIDIPNRFQTIGLFGRQNTAPSTFGAEIYNNTETEIVNANSENDLNILFSTKNIFCQPWVSGQTIGYSCPSTHLMNTDLYPPICQLQIFSL